MFYKSCGFEGFIHLQADGVLKLFLHQVHGEVGFELEDTTVLVLSINELTIPLACKGRAGVTRRF
jgi:hypothetical protein